MCDLSIGYGLLMTLAACTPFLLLIVLLALLSPHWPMPRAAH